MTYLLIFAVGLASLLVGVRLGWQLCRENVKQQILSGALDAVLQKIMLDAAVRIQKERNQ